MELTEGLPVEIYWNLHKRVFSVRHKGRVVAHVDHFDVTNARFAVSAAGNKRVRQENRKNVHAFIRGNWTNNPPTGGMIYTVTYNPYKHTSFVHKVSNQPVYASTAATGTSFNGVPQVFAIY